MFRFDIDKGMADKLYNAVIIIIIIIIIIFHLPWKIDFGLK